MNAGLQKIHKTSLKSTTAQLMYGSMCREYKRDHGALNDHAELMIYNIANMEDLMSSLREDIARNGTVKTVNNGRQHFTQPNKSVADLTRLMERQARLSARLGMAAGTTDTAGDGEPGESVEDF